MISEPEFKLKVIPLYESVKSSEAKPRLCLSWYNKGLSEYEIADRFLSLWVSLETITSGYIEREVDAETLVYYENAIRALKEIKDSDLRNRAIKSVTDAVIYKSIPEAMTKVIGDIVSPSTIILLLSPQGESKLEKVMRQLQSDRSQIIHGRKKEVTDIEKKTAFLQSLVHEILRKVFSISCTREREGEGGDA